MSPSRHPGAMSPLAPAPAAASPDINPFAPLSPDNNPPQPVPLYQHDKPLVTYSRRELLLIAAQHPNPPPPEDMGPLESWFGTISKPQSNSSYEDPAIASIGHQNGRRNNNGGNGFGEGFGYGGGIGGGSRLNNARGTRNIGLRRLPEGLDLPPHLAPPTSGGGGDKAFGGQMGRFNVKSASQMRLGGDEPKNRRNNNEADSQNPEPWRRNNRQQNGYQRDNVERPYTQRGERDHSSHQQRDRRPNNWHQPQHDEDAEPEWMNDAPAPVDSAIVSEAADPLVKFTPGEDMIAAHKRAMKTKNANDWRGGMPPLPAFFSADPAIASNSQAAPPLEAKPKEMNANNYLMQREDPVEEEPQESAPPQGGSAFSSRFHRFFGNPGGEDPAGSAGRGSASAPLQSQTPLQSQSVPTPQPPADHVDQRKATLMGLLSTKTPTPKLETPSLRRGDTPQQYSHTQITSPIENVPSSMSPNMYQNSSQYRAPPNPLLQQIYQNPNPPIPSPSHNSPTDPLQLLAQAQAQRQSQQPQRQSPAGAYPPQHMSLPPQFQRPPPGFMPSPIDGVPHPDMQGFPPFMRPPPGAGYHHQGPLPPPPGINGGGYMPMPFYQQGPPRPPGMGLGSNGQGGSQYGMQQAGPPGIMGMQPQGQRGYAQTQGQLNHSQQDMLATLFAGLEPRSQM
ncbi:hypothetical protein I350_01159 [Cryptococcus amylolentus CBS 6273]|uniref:Uncharacterized protein n=1 Tax=Cryptococcus amylolentus CBS 6273 TaxID=1296118 RepID=A0A1E3KE49_9TREE|nr:hypothetical protein I350_01159 [Cryptococcus amylolentus CBS 6273]